MATERERFEAAAFNYYTGLKAAGWSHPDEGDNTPESLFWLQPNGQYGVINLNAAWWAWQAAKQDMKLESNNEYQTTTR